MATGVSAAGYTPFDLMLLCTVFAAHSRAVEDQPKEADEVVRHQGSVGFDMQTYVEEFLLRYEHIPGEQSAYAE